MLPGWVRAVSRAIVENYFAGFVPWRGWRRVRGQGRAPEGALGVPLGEVWPNAGSSEAVRSESCGNFSDSVQLLRTRLLPNVTATFP